MPQPDGETAMPANTIAEIIGRHLRSAWGVPNGGACATAILKELDDAGCAVVPKNATEEMVQAGIANSLADYVDLFTAWQAMVDARPQ